MERKSRRVHIGAALARAVVLCLLAACGTDGNHEGSDGGSGADGGDCQLITCAELGKNCGKVADTCGGELDCGTCTGFESCGGAGVANVCGATCPASCPTGYSCSGGVCVGGNPTTLVLDVKTFTVSGSVTLNGGPPEQSCAAVGNRIALVSLTELTQGYNLSLDARCAGTGTAAAVTFSGPIYPGTYKVSVVGNDPDTSNTALPRGTPQVVNPSLSVNGNVSALALDVKTFTVSGSVTLNGGPPEQSCAATGNRIALVSLTELTKGYNLSIDARCAGTGTAAPVTFSGPIYPGTYKVSVVGNDPDTSNTALPRGTPQVVNPSLSVSGNVSALALDVKTFTVSGSVTLNGGPPEQSCAATGNRIALVSLKELTQGYNLSLDARCAGTGTAAPVTFSGPIYPGTYKVSVVGNDPDTSNTALPRGTPQVVNSSLSVSGNVSALVFDVKTFTVSGSVTLNGGPPEQSCAAVGNRIALVSLTELTQGYNLSLDARCAGTGATAAVTFSGPIYPGTYKVSVVGNDPDTSNTALPRGIPQVVTPSLSVSGNVSALALDVKTFTVSGSVTLNGGPPEQSCAATGNRIALVSLKELTQGYNLSLDARCASTGATAPVTFSGPIYPGTYKVSVVGNDPDTSNTALPRGTPQVVNSSVSVSSNVSALALDVKTFTVAGTVTLNGGPPEQSCAATGNRIALVSLTELIEGYNLSLDARCAGTGATAPVTFSGPIYPGTYKISVVGNDPDTSNTALPRGTAEVVIDRIRVP